MMKFRKKILIYLCLFTMINCFVVFNLQANNQINFTPRQVGNLYKHSHHNLNFRFGTDLQVTGAYAVQGQKIKIILEVENPKCLPRVVFTQQLGHWRKWLHSEVIKVGVNEYVVPDLYKHISQETKKGGAIYIENPYTAEEQGKISITIIGAERYPVFRKGGSVEKFMSELATFSRKVKNDKANQVIDVADIIGERLIINVRATDAYKIYKGAKFTPQDTLDAWDMGVNNLLAFNGLDNSNIKHNVENLRETLRVMQPYAYMYAAGNHLGYQIPQQAELLNPKSAETASWGFYHEIGHNLEQFSLTWSEVTTNVNSVHVRTTLVKNGDTRIDWEKHYQNVAPKERLEDFNKIHLFLKIPIFWQLELYKNGFWGDVQKYYRERDPKKSEDSFAIASSDVLKLNLNEYFLRQGFKLSENAKKHIAQYPKTTDKIWYLNDNDRFFKGDGFDKTIQPKIKIKVDKKSKNTVLTFDIAKKQRASLLGFEVIRDGEVIGFTATDKFIDKNVPDAKAHKYSVIAYARDLTKSNETFAK